jgi:hypothetical protein
MPSVETSLLEAWLEGPGPGPATTGPAAESVAIGEVW